MRYSRLLFATVLLVASTLAAHADTVYSTFGPGQTFNTSAYIISTQTIAAPFTPTETVTLTDAVLAAGESGGTSPMNVYIESSVGGAPGSILDTLTQVGNLTPTPALVDFTCSVCSVLDAGTIYFIVDQQSNTSSDSDWEFSLNAAGGIFVNHLGSATGPWQGPFSGNPEPAFEVNGSSVVAAAPEPSTLALFGTGILGLAGVARRKLS